MRTPWLGGFILLCTVAGTIGNEISAESVDWVRAAVQILIGSAIAVAAEWTLIRRERRKRRNNS